MTIRKVDAYGASLGANTFTGAQVAPSLALGGASGATLAVTGTAAIVGNSSVIGTTTIAGAASGNATATFRVFGGLSNSAGFQVTQNSTTDASLILNTTVGGTLGIGSNNAAVLTFAATTNAVAISTSLAIGGATIGSNALAVSGTGTFSGALSVDGGIASYNNFNLGASRVVGWGNGSIGTIDTAFSRITAGIIGVGTGAAGNVAGGLQAATLALGGAALSGNVLAVTGTTLLTGGVAITGSLSVTDSIQAGNGDPLGWTSAAQMYSTTNGVILLSNNSALDFNRLQFGGTGATFPAIARSGTTLKFRTADDLNDAPITAATLALGDGAISAQSVVISDAGGFYRTAAGVTAYSVSSTARVALYSGGISLPSASTLAWSSGAVGTSNDSVFYRAGANAFGFSNSAQNTGFSLSGTTADTLTVRNLANSAAGALVAGAGTFSGALTVPGVTTAALTSTGTFTSGAAAQVGTLTNAPAAGNPTTWIKIIDNGVTRYIPAW